MYPSPTTPHLAHAADGGQRFRRCPPSGAGPISSSDPAAVSKHDDGNPADSVQPLDFSNKVRHHDVPPSVAGSVGDEQASLSSMLPAAACLPANLTHLLQAAVASDAVHFQPVQLFPASPPLFPAALFASSPLPLLGLLMRQVAVVSAAAANGAAAAFPAGLTAAVFPQLPLPSSTSEIPSTHQQQSQLATQVGSGGGGGAGDGDIVVSSSSDDQPGHLDAKDCQGEQQQQYHLFRQQILQQLSQQQQQQQSSSGSNSSSTTTLDPKGIAYMERRERTHIKLCFFLPGEKICRIS
jgi:hypothetical protein